MEKPLVSKPFSPYAYPMMMKYGGLHMPIVMGKTRVNIPRLNVG